VLLVDFAATAPRFNKAQQQPTITFSKSDEHGVVSQRSHVATSVPLQQSLIGKIQPLCLPLGVREAIRFA
jgi:hypothetical protein